MKQLMNLFARIFGRQPQTPEASSDPLGEVILDDALAALDRELSGLAQIEVSRAAKERGWAQLTRELERRPVRRAGRTSTRRVSTARRSRSSYRTPRWLLGSAAAAVAVIAALIGTYAGGLLQTAGNDNPLSTAVSVVSSDSTEPVSTASTGASTSDTGGPLTTGTEPDTTVTTGPSPDTTTGGTTPTTSGATGTTATTKPPSPATTGGTQYAAGEREGSAKALAIYLADMVITGNTSGAGALVAPEAQSALAQMSMSLNEPYGYRVTGVMLLSEDTVRITMDINDRVAGGQGQLLEVLKHFVIKVQVAGDDGAVVTAINAGS